MDAATTEPLAILGALLFTLVGPIKVMPIFDALTRTMTPRARAGLALRAAGFGALGVAIAAEMGATKIESVGISREALGAATGLVLAIVGLPPLIGVEIGASAGPDGPPDAFGLAFPTLLPPYAFGLIILISLYLPASTGVVRVASLGVLLMAINALAMIAAPVIMRRIGLTPLRLLGAVFGIIQLALGIQMLFWGISHGMRAV